MLSQRQIKGRSSSVVAIDISSAAALAAKPSQSKSNSFIINLDNSSSLEEASKEVE
jgi:hypothetical protein